MVAGRVAKYLAARFQLIFPDPLSEFRRSHKWQRQADQNSNICRSLVPLISVWSLWRSSNSISIRLRKWRGSSPLFPPRLRIAVRTTARSIAAIPAARSRLAVVGRLPAVRAARAHVAQLRVASAARVDRRNVPGRHARSRVTPVPEFARSPGEVRIICWKVGLSVAGCREVAQSARCGDSPARVHLSGQGAFGSTCVFLGFRMRIRRRSNVKSQSASTGIIARV